MKNWLHNPHLWLGFVWAGLYGSMILFLLATLYGAHRPPPVALEKTTLASLQPGKGMTVFYVRTRRDRTLLEAGTAYLTVVDARPWPGCLLTTYETGRPDRMIGQWRLELEEKGITFWGTGRSRLKHGLTVPRLSPVDNLKTLPVQWVDRSGKIVPDTGTYGVESGPRDLYTLTYRFRERGTFSLIFSAFRSKPAGIVLVE